MTPTLQQSISDADQQQYLEQAKKATEIKNYEYAIDLLTTLLHQEPHHHQALAYLGYVYNLTGRIDLAREVYEKAHHLYPNDPIFLNGLANCFNADGNFTEALHFFTKASALDPGRAIFIYNMAWAKGFQVNDAFTQHCLAVHASTTASAEDRMFICYALAGIYEQKKEYPRAFSFYEEANAIQQREHPFKEKGSIDFFERIVSWFTPEVIASMRAQARASFTPIFVLGMPRSGTTLTEQILASHKDVHGAGEVDILRYVLDRVGHELTGIRYPESFYQIRQDILDKLASAYLEKLGKYNTDGKLFVVDKTPFNFVGIAAIAILFPDAPIIHCRRDPMDNCWSIYSRYFQGYHSYKCEQKMLGHYYQCYQKLMQHWHKIMPGRIHDVQYEALVEDPEAVIRPLLAHCHLPWDAQCMQSHKTKRVVATASTKQVRQAIYKTPVKPWLPFKDYLKPLQATLEGSD